MNDSVVKRLGIWGLTPRSKGVVLILLSALFFYLATFFVNLCAERFDVSGSYYLLPRFVLGLPLFYWFYRRQKIPIKNMRWLILRAIFNVIAVLFFLYSAFLASALNANVLNMTYPAFVALLSPVFIGEKNSWLNWISIFAAIFGAVLIISAGKNLQFSVADLLGLASGIAAGIGVMSLRQIRKTDSTFNVLYFTFLFGSIISLLAIIVNLIVQGTIPSALSNPQFWLWYSVSGLAGVLGQWLFTHGFAFVNAVEGSILSSSRILIALFFGIFYFHEPFTLATAIGAVLVFFSNVALGYGKK